MIQVKLLTLLLVARLRFMESADLRDQGLRDYLVDLVDYYVDEPNAGYVSFILGSSIKTDLAEELIRYIHGRSCVKSLVLNLKEEQSVDKFSTRIDNYLGFLIIQFIFTDAIEDVTNFIDRGENLNVYNTRSRIIAIINEPIDYVKLKEMFSYLWSRKYLNVVVLYEIEQTINGFTYNPFRSDKLESFMGSARRGFYNKLKDMNGNDMTFLLIREEDTAKARMVKYPNGSKYYTGSEIEVFRTVAEYFKARMVVKCVDDIIYKDGTMVNPWRQFNSDIDIKGLQLDIIHKEMIDMIVSEELIIPEERQRLTMWVYPHSTDDLMVLVKKADKIPQSLYLLLIFTPYTWCLFLTTFLIGAVTWSIISKDYEQPVFNITRMTTGGSLPTTSYPLPERILITSYLLYSLIITTAFVSNLATALMQEKYYNEIDTIDDLINSHFILSVFNTQRIELKKAFNNTPKFPYFNKTILTPDRYINRNASLNNLTSLFFDYIPKHPIVANHERSLMVMMFKGIHRTIHVMRESPLPNHLSYKLPLRSPFYDEINLVVRKMVEAGLYIYWKKMHVHELVITKTYEPDEYFVVESKIRALSVYHFETAFVWLAIGSGLSTLVFIVELAFDNLKHRLLTIRKKKRGFTNSI